MKVAIFTNEYPPNIYGGAGVHVDYLVRELSKFMDVDVHCFGDQKVKSGRITVQGHRPSFKGACHCEGAKQPKQSSEISYFHEIASRPKVARNDKKLFETFSTDLEMASALKGADIIHCHTWYSHLAGLIAKQMHRVPLVTTTHSFEPSRPWKVEQLGSAYYVSSWIERMIMEQADGIIAVSKGMKADAIRFFGVPEDKIRVIHNGIDLEEYKPTVSTEALSKYGVALDRPYVLFVGRITRQKGIIHLVHAIRHIDKQAQIVLCAGAPDTKEIAEEMRTAVNEERALRDGIIWIEEMVNKKDVIELYTHAAVFCCPSVYEPFGIINLEAMACRTAVVGSRVGGIPEIIVDGETGYLVELSEDTEAFSRGLAEKINMVLKDKDSQKRFGENGRRRVEELFSWRAIAARTANYYKELKWSSSL